MPIEAVTVREASYVADVSCTAVNRAIDEQKLPLGLVGAARERLLTREGVLMLAVEKELEHRVLPRTRADLRDKIARLLRAERGLAGLGEVAIEEGPIKIVVSLGAIADRIEAKWRRLSEALALIVEDPEIQAGAPTFRGTRVLVRPVAEALERGVPGAELLEDYPALTPEMLAAARLHAAVRPQRGRPKADTEGLTPRSVRRVERAA